MGTKNYCAEALSLAFRQEWADLSLAGKQCVEADFRVVLEDPEMYGYSSDQTMKALAKQYQSAIGSGHLLSYAEERL